MKPIAIRYEYILAAGVLVLFSALAPAGSEEKSKLVAEKYTCKDETITVDPAQAHGVDDHHKAIFLCEDHKVKWVGNGHRFTVTFVDSPFKDGTKTFSNSDAKPDVTSGPAAYPPDLMVYKYSITIDGGTSFDPHVVSGGGIPITLK